MYHPCLSTHITIIITYLKHYLFVVLFTVCITIDTQMNCFVLLCYNVFSPLFYDFKKLDVAVHKDTDDIF